MDSVGTKELLAKSRRLVLISRNLLRLLARRIDAAEELKSRRPEPVRVHTGRGATTPQRPRRD